MIMIVMVASFMKNKIAIASSREEICGRCPVILLIESDIWIRGGPQPRIPKVAQEITMTTCCRYERIDEIMNYDIDGDWLSWLAGWLAGWGWLAGLAGWGWLAGRLVSS